MVWFQCEDCGEELKKPKLPNHFRCCSAYKLSCIDCGVTFDQQSVQTHNQCISEAEKYGPKGPGKASNGTQKVKSNSKQKPDVDINVGLSARPPWFCRLCNTNATSQQALLLHAEGKKHRAKARAFHASSQPAKPTEESTPKTDISTENSNKDVTESKEETPTKVSLAVNGSEAENGNLKSNKKRKSPHAGNENEGNETEFSAHKEDGVVKFASAKEDSKKDIKWKKLITSTLKSNPDGVMKMRKLRKLLVEAIQDSGIKEDEVQLSDMLEQKINSSSRFTVDSKYVRLVAKK